MMTASLRKTGRLAALLLLLPLPVAAWDLSGDLAVEVRHFDVARRLSIGTDGAAGDPADHEVLGNRLRRNERCGRQDGKTHNDRAVHGCSLRGTPRHPGADP